MQFKRLTVRADSSGDPGTAIAAALASTALLCGCAGANRVQSPSENYSSRIQLVVLHHTSENFADSLRILTKPSDYPVSSHYLVPEPGDPTYDRGKLEVYELVPETGRAWHAGASYWGGRTNLNDQSIGIEIVNETYCHRSAADPLLAADDEAPPQAPAPPVLPGDVAGAAPPGNAAKPGIQAFSAPPRPKKICFFPDFPESQMTLVIGLLSDILERHPGISPTNIVGHSDIAPDRKIDPGPRFPWQRLYRLGFGAWYDDATVIRYWERFRYDMPPLETVQSALNAYGYGIEANGLYDEHMHNVVRAFQLHFQPQESTGELGVDTVAILFALLEKYFPERLPELLPPPPPPPP